MLLLVIQSFTLSAQNLVVNGDFESYNNCPYGFTNPQLGNNGIVYDPSFTNFPVLIGWVRPAYWNTPDYLNACMPGQLFAVNNMGVPENYFGFQYAHSGTGYVGTYAYSAQNVNGVIQDDYREAIATKLTQPMVKDKEYCVTFYASPTARSAAGGYNMICIYEIGASFTVNYPDSNASSMSLPLDYDVMNPVNNYLIDTSKWYKISGIYKATGNEQWMTIACFNATAAPPAVGSPGTELEFAL